MFALQKGFELGLTHSLCSLWIGGKKTIPELPPSSKNKIGTQQASQHVRNAALLPRRACAIRISSHCPPNPTSSSPLRREPRPSSPQTLRHRSMAAIPARLHHHLIVVFVFILLLVPSLAAAQSRAFGGTTGHPICRSL